jgi:hypothetical protein
MRSGRRPSFSIVQNEIGVLATLTTVVTMEIRNGFESPTLWKNVVLSVSNEKGQ